MNNSQPSRLLLHQWNAQTGNMVCQFCYVFVVVEWQFEYASFDVHDNFSKSGWIGQRLHIQSFITLSGIDNGIDFVE